MTCTSVIVARNGFKSTRPGAIRAWKSTMSKSREPRIIPRWLKLKDATLYSAIGINRLVSLAEDGTIRGFKDPDSKRGDWIFDRDSLDQYREGQAVEGVGARVNERVMEILAERRKKDRY